MNSYLAGYEPYRGEIPSRNSGSLVCDRIGEAVAYGIFHLEPRGRIFVVPCDKATSIRLSFRLGRKLQA